MNYAIILSGGIGTRMQMGDFPKQYLEVEKKPILLYTLEQFQKSSAVEKIVIVAADAWREKIRGWMEEDGITKFLAFADAGDTRQESIHNGLTVCMEDSVSENDGVIIHDGVRPLVSEQLIGDCLAALADHLVQAAAGVVVLLVDLQVLGQLVDAGGQNGDLHLGGAGVSGMGAVGLDHGRLFVFTDHGEIPPFFFAAHGAA